MARRTGRLISTPKDRLTIGTAADLVSISHRGLYKVEQPAPKAPKLGEPSDWTKVDWNLSDGELGAIYGLNAQFIRSKRQEVAPNSGPILFRDVWRDVDWSLSDAQIAESLGLAEQAVTAGRRRMESGRNLPPTSPVQRGRRRKSSGRGS